MSKKRKARVVRFYSKHRKNSVTIPDPDNKGKEKIIRFRPSGMVGVVDVSTKVANLMKKHVKYNGQGLGVFTSDTILKGKKKGNVVRGAKGAGTIIKDDTKEPKVKSDKKVVTPVPAKKAPKKKTSKKKVAKKKPKTK